MDEHILIQIVGRDKAVSAKIIEELHDGAHLAILGLAGGRRCRRERPFDRQQILDHPAMFMVLSDTVTTSPVRSRTRPNLSSVER